MFPNKNSTHLLSSFRFHLYRNISKSSLHSLCSSPTFSQNDEKFWTLFCVVFYSCWKRMILAVWIFQIGIIFYYILGIHHKFLLIGIHFIKLPLYFSLSLISDCHDFSSGAYISFFRAIFCFNKLYYCFVELYSVFMSALNWK